MGDDLGTGAGGVHDTADMVLRFWLEETPTGKRFSKDTALDREIADRFGAARDAVLARGAEGWADEPRTLLAAIILIDQFSRNIYRGRAEAFAGDALARSLTEMALARGWDTPMTATERQFLYMPLMHSEDMSDQTASVALFEKLGDAGDLKFARAHAEIIDRFGRFPARNAALGRDSTPGEIEYLSQPGAGF